MIINFIYLLLSSFVFFWFYINIKKNGLKWIIKGLFQIGILVLFIGLFSFDEKLYYNLLTIFIILVTTVISWLMFKSKGFEKFCFIMILGGSFGNIFDRIFYSAVPDFIDIHFYNYHWFIFNVADIFITLGIISLISIEIFNSKNKKKNESS